MGLGSRARRRADPSGGAIRPRGRADLGLEWMALVAGYLAGHAPSGVRIGLGGRSRERLAGLRARLGASSSWPLLAADVTDAASLAVLARATRVVVTTAGPYRRHGAVSGRCPRTRQSVFLPLRPSRNHRRGRAARRPKRQSCWQAQCVTLLDDDRGLIGDPARGDEPGGERPGSGSGRGVFADADRRIEEPRIRDSTGGIHRIRAVQIASPRRPPAATPAPAAPDPAQPGQPPCGHAPGSAGDRHRWRQPARPPPADPARPGPGKQPAGRGHRSRHRSAAVTDPSTPRRAGRARGPLPPAAPAQRSPAAGRGPCRRSKPARGVQPQPGTQRVVPGTADLGAHRGK